MRQCGIITSYGMQTGVSRAWVTQKIINPINLRLCIV